MRLRVSMLLALGALATAGCGGDAPCVDEDNNELNFCEVEVAGVPEPLVYCPGEHWGAEDGCNSCGCDENGEKQCTKIPECEVD